MLWLGSTRRGGFSLVAHLLTPSHHFLKRPIQRLWVFVRLNLRAMSRKRWYSVRVSGGCPVGVGCGLRGMGTHIARRRSVREGGGYGRRTLHAVKLATTKPIPQRTGPIAVPFNMSGNFPYAQFPANAPSRIIAGTLSHQIASSIQINALPVETVVAVMSTNSSHSPRIPRKISGLFMCGNKSFSAMMDQQIKTTKTNANVSTAYTPLSAP